MAQPQSDSVSWRRRVKDLAQQPFEGRVLSPTLGNRRSLFGRHAVLLERLQEQERLLYAAYQHFVKASKVELATSYASEWLLDNFYVIEQAIRQIREHMPIGYYRELPKLSDPPLEGYPRIYALAWEITEYFESQLDLDRVRRSVKAYQRVTPLTMGELWALPTMLRIGILENLTRAVASITHVDSDQTKKPSDVAQSLANSLENEAIVASCIQSLRMLANQDWKAFFEEVNTVDQLLKQDPAGVYAEMSFDTRDRYRGVIEDLAHASTKDEKDVAQAAVHLAKEALAADGEEGGGRRTHIGFYLLDAGRAALETYLDYRPSLSRRLSRWGLDHPTLLYLGGIFIITLVTLAGLMVYASQMGGTTGQLIGTALLVLLPISSMAVNVVNWLVVRLVPPRLLPRLDFEVGIPDAYRTMIVVPSLLTDAHEVKSLLHQLELHYLGNTDDSLYFALLTDFGDAPQKYMPGDDALLAQAEEGIRELNRKYGQQRKDPFFLFHREREWNAAEECWMGWERKRGKLVEFNRLIMGQETSFSLQIGDLDVLPGVVYAITLDADTLMPREGARSLVATMAHPLNRAQFDPDTGAVTAGYTVLQPRVEIKLAGDTQSLFTKIFSGDTGLDLYTRAVSDVYQDLFGEGIYAGKGIYDIAAFERSLDGLVPDNALLSHDLFEGVHGRAGLVSDVVLYEDYPLHYLAHVRRLHRWVRGDWQLLPWLFPKVPGADGEKVRNTLSLIDRWKILDNLRRSLLAPALLMLLIAGWVWLPGSTLFWTLAGIMVLALLVFFGVFTVLRRTLQGTTFKWAVRSVGKATLRWLLALVFLPYESLVMADGIASTLYRMYVSRKRLLQWTTAAHTLRLFGRRTRIGVMWRQMWSATVISLLLTAFVMFLQLPSIVIAAPLLISWVLSPLIAFWISRTVPAQQTQLSEAQYRQLRYLARRTWLYFEQFIGPDDQWLPPDHFQEDPLGIAAHRTSPTNIGLAFLSALAAYDLGYMGPLDVMLRLRPTFETMSRMEQYRGHLLNWYDTRNLRPLPPRYVSTVDSGNLVGCLLALRQGCLAMPEAAVLCWRRWQGMLDTLGILLEIVEHIQGEATVKLTVRALRDHLVEMRRQVTAVRESPGAWAKLLSRLSDEGWRELERLLISLVESGSRALGSDTLRDLHIWSERISAQLLSMQGEIDMLMPWLLPLSDPPVLFSQPDVDSTIGEAWQALRQALPMTPQMGDIPDVCRRGRERAVELSQRLARDGGIEEATSDERDELVQQAYDWCKNLAEDLYSARMAAESLLIGLQDIAHQCESYFQGMDFEFLFDDSRQVFHIGFNVDSGSLAANYYDLLASEARIASLLAIAKGDILQSHWLHLSRPITRVNGSHALLSWNGTMFEYLMPSLLLHGYEGTLLEESNRAVVNHQISYGQQRGTPWGISESSYYRFDTGMHYQYQGFGVPGLGFKRGLGDDLVIAPYASLLALPLAPQRVMENVRHLKEEGMLGRYGFYEAVDYTRSRVPQGEKKAIVKSYMVHHHGMSLLAMVNYLYDNVMVQRVHADPRVQSVQLLLQEQVPSRVPVETPHPDEDARAARRVEALVPITPWRVPINTPVPQVHVLSNGSYSVLITGSGGGYSRWRGKDLTRWRPDTTLDDWGTWLYVRDRDSGDVWSAGYQPTRVESESYEPLFFAHKAEFGRRDHDVSLRMEITVPPEDDVEVRRVTLTNHSDRRRYLTLTSYGEVVLAPHAVDRRHQAFNKLFIMSEYLPELNGLSFRRRLRSADEEPIHLIHMVVPAEGRASVGGHEVDRAAFIGRGRTPRSPVALRDGASAPPDLTGAPLDPIMALGQDVVLEPHSTAQIAYVTLVSKAPEELKELARRYQSWPRVDRAFDVAHAGSELELHRLGLATADLKRTQELLSVLLFPYAGLRADPETLKLNVKGQPGLWPYGISGDYPILLVRISDQDEMELLRELLQAHAYWRGRQVMIDLVILNERESGYDQELQGHIQRLVSRLDSDAWLNQRGGIFILRYDQLTQEDRLLLHAAARAILDGKAGSLLEQLGRLHDQPVRLPRFVPTKPSARDTEPISPVPRPEGLLFDNGLGGFSPDGREYVIYLDQPQQGEAIESSEAAAADGGSAWTPLPWVNVIANDTLGFLISEAGSGYTWALNSGENRLTPWRNDPVSDTPGEVLYLRDEETAKIWSPTPLPAPDAGPYLVRHGAGYSVFEHHSQGLKQQTSFFVAPDAPVKVIRLRLENTWRHVRRITITFYAEWVLGTTRDMTQQYVVPEFDSANKVLLARNAYNEEFGERVAFVAASRDLHGLTCDRQEFLGQQGRLDRPAALRRIGLGGTVQAGLDPCAALQVHVDLAPDEAQHVYFVLGQGQDRQQAIDLATRYRDPDQAEHARRAVDRFWDRVLGTVTIETPEPAMDVLLNRWLLYQALSCRIWGRSALYQSSGAFGYRDQLQDVMALTHAAPDLMRRHILEAARHQFEAGDVLHWWHPPSGRGVRTRCSDDLLWLPFVTAHYVTATGDEDILDEQVPFLNAEPLEPGELERYGHYQHSNTPHTLYDHCSRAIEKGMTSGVHGLPLIGSHDWNDGFSRVGVQGKGESIWLAWFLGDVLKRFAPICEQRGDLERAEIYRQRVEVLAQAVEEHGWDWGWYRRAYYDDGTPLGSSENEEAQIDSLAQSWAVLSDIATSKRAVKAMNAVDHLLVCQDERLILLFTPPFDETEHDPGYIKGYPPGVRENGGQYTHAALWVVWAFAEMGDGDRAQELFQMINPVLHGHTTEEIARYKVEPYVVAADVYSVEPYIGRGGWTWYTGSAGWMYRLGVEAILGLRKVGGNLTIDPCIPQDWDGYQATYRYGETVYHIHVESPDEVNQGVKMVILDGEALSTDEIPLLSDGQEHEVRVLMVERRFL